MDVLATTRSIASVALTAALMQSVSTATITTALGNTAQTVQSSYAPGSGTNFAPSISNTLTLGSLIPTTSALQYGYKNTQGNCYLGGATATLYWDEVPCFYLHVTPNRSEAQAISGTVTLNGTNPSGVRFTAGPYSVYSDGSGGGYIYIFYNSGIGDAGNYTFSMAYNGDGNFQSSASPGTVTASVNPLPTTTTLTGPTMTSGWKHCHLYRAHCQPDFFQRISVWALCHSTMERRCFSRTTRGATQPRLN